MNRKWIFALFVSTALLLGQFCVQPAYALAYRATNLYDLFVGQVFKTEYIKQLTMTPAQQTKTRKICKETINNVMVVLPRHNEVPGKDVERTCPQSSQLKVCATVTPNLDGKTKGHHESHQRQKR